MITAKHFLDPAESGDGPRLWVEPIGLTRDLREWCSVDEVLPLLGPPRHLREWFAGHPDEYERFRDLYHEWLSTSRCRRFLERLARTALRTNFTLLHAGDDPAHNCATALSEFITELQAYCPQDN